MITINFRKLDETLLTTIYTNCNKTEMQSNFYEKLNNFSKPLFLIIYGFCIFYLFLTKKEVLPTFILYPFILLVTNLILRKILKRERPFKNKNLNLQGLGESKSFSLPSNHASSSIVIGLFIYYVNPILSLIVIFLAIVTSFCRVARGYHYPWDIIFSTFLATILFILSFIFPIVL